MTRRQILPAGLVLLGLLAVGGCATGGGLRVEGSGTPVTVTVTPPASTATKTPRSFSSPTPTKPGGSGKPTVELGEAEVVSLEAVRQTLLASDRVDPDIRTVLRTCKVVDRCMRLGAKVDVMHSGRLQQVVTVNTVDGFIFGGFLLALEPAGPRLIWDTSAEQLKIYSGKDGDLVVESKVFGLNDRVCCPSGSKVEVYRWNGQQMTRLSEQYQKGD